MTDDPKDDCLREVQAFLSRGVLLHNLEIQITYYLTSIYGTNTIISFHSRVFCSTIEIQITCLLLHEHLPYDCFLRWTNLIKLEPHRGHTTFPEFQTVKLYTTSITFWRRRWGEDVEKAMWTSLLLFNSTVVWRPKKRKIRYHVLSHPSAKSMQQDKYAALASYLDKSGYIRSHSGQDCFVSPIP